MTNTPHLRRLFSDDSGFSMVLAVSVAFIILALGAIWNLTATHELFEVKYTGHRAQAQTTAEAGARYAMAALTDNIVNDDWIGVSATNNTTALVGVGLRTALDNPTFAYVASGTNSGQLGSECQLTAHRSSNEGEQLGEWWVRVTPLAGDKWHYQIESWGWSPSPSHRQHVVQKVAIQVRLIADTEGFTHALFAENLLSGGNQKTIYGDTYAGGTVTIGNKTSLQPNDGGHPGTGRLRIAGDLIIESGSNNTFAGPVDVQGVIRDAKAKDGYTTLNVHNDETADPTTFYNNQSSFNNAEVSDEARFREGSWSGEINGTAISNVTTMSDVPKSVLPSFTWDPFDYSNETVHTSGAAFEQWIKDHKNTLSGVHYVPGSVNLDFNNTTMTGSLMIVSEGSMSVTQVPASGPSATPLDLILIQLDPEGTLSTVNQVVNVDGLVNMLLFSNGKFKAANLTRIWGAVYGMDDISDNHLEVHFRAVGEDLLAGFSFPAGDSSFIAEPLVWRSLSPSDPTPITDYCSVPGGAAASVPAPGATTPPTTTPAATTPPTTTAPTTTMAPEKQCLEWKKGQCQRWG